MESFSLKKTVHTTNYFTTLYFVNISIVLLAAA